jgi:integrase
LKKNEDMWREVPVSKQIRSELTEFVKEERKQGEDLFSFGQRMCNYIFDRAREKVLNKDFRLHDLRHAFAFRMLEKMNNLEKVRRLLGHSGYDYLKTYLEHSQRDLEPEMEAAIGGRD